MLELQLHGNKLSSFLLVKRCLMDLSEIDERAMNQDLPVKGPKTRAYSSTLAGSLHIQQRDRETEVDL